MKNDMPKFGHIKNYITRRMKKHRIRGFSRKAVPFKSIWAYLRERIENLLGKMSMGDPELLRFWQSALTTGH